MNDRLKQHCLDDVGASYRLRDIMYNLEEDQIEDFIECYAEKVAKQQTEPLKEALLHAGKLATAANKVLNSKLPTLSWNLENLAVVLEEYCKHILSVDTTKNPTP